MTGRSPLCPGCGTPPLKEGAGVPVGERLRCQGCDRALRLVWYAQSRSPSWSYAPSMEVWLTAVLDDDAN